MSKPMIAYIRASTNPELQVNSVDIQTSILQGFAKAHDYVITDTFVEYQSGSNDERVEFNKALKYAISRNCVLATWKVDRLARTMSIFSRIQDSLHLLRFCELGDTEPSVLTLGVLLGVAYQERLNTSVRVKAAYTTLKEKNPDHPWGDPNMATNAQPLGVIVRQANASVFNARIQEIVSDLNKAGYTDSKIIVAKLNSLGILTRRGKPFSVRNLSRVLTYEVQHGTQS